VYFGAGKSGAKSESENNGTRDGRTRTQEQPRVTTVGDPKQPKHKLRKEGLGGWGSKSENFAKKDDEERFLAESWRAEVKA
jgi:hypothetical protein